MQIKVRSSNVNGKLLFEWDPVQNEISIVQKGMFYKVQLLPQSTAEKYKTVERPPKTEHFNRIK